MSTPQRTAQLSARSTPKRVVVELEPDVASVFRDSESVNALLRAVVLAMPSAAPAMVRTPSNAKRLMEAVESLETGRVRSRRIKDAAAADRRQGGERK